MFLCAEKVAFTPGDEGMWTPSFLHVSSGSLATRPPALLSSCREETQTGIAKAARAIERLSHHKPYALAIRGRKGFA